MKLTTAVPLVGGIAVGYVLGAAAGRARFQQIKTAGANVVHHPKVQQTLFDLSGQAKTNAQRLPGPAASLVDTAVNRLQGQLDHPVVNGVSQPEAAAPSATPPRSW